MKGDIRRLPPSILRLIAQRLCLWDLGRLFWTFDKNIQKLLAFPGVVDVVRLDSPTINGLNLYFLRSLRDVTRVEVLTTIKWPLTETPLLSTLNPLELRLDDGIITPEIASMVQDRRSQGRTRFERRMDRRWKSSERAALELVTPRLTHLELFFPNDDSKIHHSTRYRSFPPSLTSFKHINSGVLFPIASLLATLPPSIRSLSVQEVFLPFNAAQIVAMFPLLEHLHVNSKRLIWETPDMPLQVPSSCSSLSVSSDMETFIRFFKSSGPTAVSKVAITLIDHHDKRHSLPIDFDNLLPRTVVDLSIALDPELFEPRSSVKPDFDWVTLSLPFQLTSLSLDVFSEYSSVIEAIKPLEQLQMLYLNSCQAAVKLVAKPLSSGTIKRHTHLTIYSSLLARSLTSLSLLSSRIIFGSGVFEALPPKLVSLSLASFDLKLFKAFRSHFPKCHLRIARSFDLWNCFEAHRLECPSPPRRT